MSILLWLKYFEKKMFESLFPLNCSSIDFDFVAGTLNFLLFRFHRRWKIIDFNLLLKFISVAVLFMGFLFRSLSFFFTFNCAYRHLYTFHEKEEGLIQFQENSTTLQHKSFFNEMFQFNCSLQRKYFVFHSVYIYFVNHSVPNEGFRKA